MKAKRERLKPKNPNFLRLVDFGFLCSLLEAETGTSPAYKSFWTGVIINEDEGVLSCKGVLGTRFSWRIAAMGVLSNEASGARLLLKTGVGAAEGVAKDLEERLVADDNGRVAKTSFVGRERGGVVDGAWAGDCSFSGTL